MPTDFMGNELHVGDYVARYGGGNSGISYGMVLHRVCGITPHKVKLESIAFVNSAGETRPTVRQSTISRLSAMAKVEVPRYMHDIWEAMKAGTAPEEVVRAWANWQHGTFARDSGSKEQLRRLYLLWYK